MQKLHTASDRVSWNTDFRDETSPIYDSAIEMKTKKFETIMNMGHTGFLEGEFDTTLRFQKFSNLVSQSSRRCLRGMCQKHARVVSVTNEPNVRAAHFVGVHHFQTMLSMGKQEPVQLVENDIGSFGRNVD